ncbi:MAG: hypothetical protein ACXADF_08415 [Candidatus Thorarchaeota archaeon]
MRAKMAEGRNRFIPPTVFVIAGIAIAFFAVNRIIGPLGGPFASQDLVGAIDGAIYFDIISLMILALPIYFIEFILLSIPIAAIMIFLNKLYRAKSYTQSVIPVGNRFGAARIIRRALVPALFSLSFSEIVLGLFPDYIIAVPEYPAEVAFSAIVRTVEPMLWLVGALFAVGIAIPIYAPTWLLNDSGIVTHLKKNELEMRRCPDTEGVGKWFSQYLTGFAILSYPVAIAHKYIVVLPSLILSRGGTIGINYIFESLVWIVGLPLIVMAFILPVIIINEIVLSKTSSVMRSVARGLGATELRLADVEPAVFQDDIEQ